MQGGNHKLTALSMFVLRRRRRRIEQKRFQSPAEERMTVLISQVLRIGILVSASIVLLGGILYLSRHGKLTPDYAVFSGEPSELCNLTGVLRAALSFSARGIIQLGLMIMIATPVVRVAMALYAFHSIGDQLYVGVAAIVLTLLILSITGVVV